ncbi:MAG: PEPxxWA-CTERM sorting domain-containing protein [Alphaproteobacteria bacterium]|nr:PEPxxWA-CTERM sorting domain-containing protein [Alphaproteobacteria bacterium]MBU1513188.1 PEPxxWA-CTERM sorting domain-containing protein [Alphaproteobacteria bacterium]MBU2095296.1 PEPxxWA-CTERM sorting domain-containing protein [Alphaproteobacteria bacterium]MBU2152211.1 PEPxxWA-CTERM sorting domain-containing protein [Alphaproteobacteria bacterium]MBU2306742.1 PEPxxWA-CTERM sorting domain-containing protein [Alphaproteobacteria bacterium]
MRNVLSLSALGAALILSASPAAAATVLNVDTNESCGKTTCFNDKGVFSQTWSAKDASGPMTIGQILLARGVLGSLDGAMFRLSFTLNGKEIGSWGSYSMGGIAGDELTFTGETFIWNPEDGDLSLVLEIAQPKAGGGLFVSNIGEAKPGGPEQNDIGGPERGPSPAPEPAAWALMIAGFGLAGATLRRRGRVVASLQPSR